MDTDDLTRDQKVDFVLAVHELGRLAEEWARSATPLTDKELDRFQGLCAELGVSESSLLTRYQRKSRADAFDRTFGNPLIAPPKFFENLPMPKRHPQPVPPPVTQDERWVQDQEARAQAYGGPDTKVITTPAELRQSVPNAAIAETSEQIQKLQDDPGMEGQGANPATVRPEYQLPHTDAEAAKVLDIGSMAPSNVVKDPKARRKPGPERAKVVGAVPTDPHGKIKMAPPETPAEQTTSIEAVKEDGK